MALKGFQVNGTVYKYDYDALENKPTELPEVGTTDEGKFLRVNASGEWAAAAVPEAEGGTF